MNTLNNILVVVDPHLRPSPALDRGAELARQSGASLHLCLFDYDAEPHHGTDADAKRRAHDDFVRQRTNWLSQQAAALTARGISVTSEFVETAEPHRAILAKALQLQPGIVIKDMHPQSQYQWLVFSPDEDQLRNLCPAPLMIVRAASAHLPQRILAAVDTGSGTVPAEPVNETIVQTALVLGKSAGAEVHLAHVFAHKALAGDAYEILRDTESEVRAAASGYFERFAQRFGFAPERYHWVEGKPAEALAELTTQIGADLMILGHAYHSRLAEFLIGLVGSTSERLVERTAGDVLFVPSDNFVAELGRHMDLDAVCREYGVTYRKAA